MVSIDTQTSRHDGVTLVTVRLSGDGIARRVRVDHRLDGPVWPPRSEGRPEPGWDETGYEGVVPADGRLVLGYATPAPPDGTSVTLEEGEARRAATHSPDLDDPTAVLQRLGDPAPPREAVPLPTDGRVSDADAPVSDGDASDSSTTLPSDSDDSGEIDDEPVDESVTESVDTPVTEPRREPRSDTVTAWLDRVEDRVESVERLAGAESVSEATAALTAIGGLDAGQRAVRATEADRRRLLAVAARAAQLADRVDATDADLTTLGRLR